MNSNYDMFRQRSNANMGQTETAPAQSNANIGQTAPAQKNANMRQSTPAPLITDFGPNPFVVDIEKATIHNDTFRTALWTGNHLQLTLMSIPIGEDIGLEIHPEVDQFLRIESGQGLVQMGDSQDNLYFRQPVFEDSAIFVPAGTWHNVTNTGRMPLKLYAIYAPPNHPWGTVHQTKEIAQEMGD